MSDEENFEEMVNSIDSLLLTLNNKMESFGNIAETGSIHSIITSIINEKDKKGMTVLHCAVMMGKEDLVDKLLQHGANVNCRNFQRITPLHCAAAGFSDKIVQLLLDYGAYVNSQTVMKCSPLHCVVNDEEKFDYFQQKKAISDKALKIKHKKQILRCLLNHGAFVDCRTSLNYTPLHFAVNFYDEEIISLLLEYGADPNVRNDLSMFPLHYAVKNQGVEAVYLLLQHGARANVKDFLGRTPLHYAFARWDRCILRLLLDHATDVNCSTLDDFISDGILSLRRHYELRDTLAKHIILNGILSIQRHDELRDILSEHIIKLKYLNLIENKKTLKCVENRMNDFQRRCEIEVHMMKNERIYEQCGVSFYDLLTHDWNRIMLYLKNEDGRRELLMSCFEITFPIYSTMISHRIRLGTDKVKLFNETHELLRSLLNNVFELPNECILRIMSYFSEKDIKFLRSSHKL